MNHYKWLIDHTQLWLRPGNEWHFKWLRVFQMNKVTHEHTHAHSCVRSHAKSVYHAGGFLSWKGKGCILYLLWHLSNHAFALANNGGSVCCCRSHIAKFRANHLYPRSLPEAVARQNLSGLPISPSPFLSPSLPLSVFLFVRLSVCLLTCLSPCYACFLLSAWNGSG